MNVLRLIGLEFRNIAARRKLLISLIGVIIIPLLYSSLFLWAFWDPYGKMDKLPVAVVNSDQGTTYNGKTVNVGGDLVQQLKGNSDFHWEFVSPTEATQGLQDNRYYMTVTIPKDFSKDSMSVTKANPTRAQLSYTLNDGYNYLSAQISQSAMEKVKEQVSQTLTKDYAQSIYEALGQMQTGMQQASQGAGSVASGVTRLGDGINTAAGSVNSLTSGAVLLQQQMGVALSGAKTLDNGIQSIAGGTGTLSNGLSQLNTGATKLTEASAQTSAGATKLAQGLSTASLGSKQLTSGSLALSANLQALASQLASSPMAVQDPQLVANVQALAKSSTALAAGISQQNQGMQTLLSGAQQLSTAEEQLHAGLGQFSGQLHQASEASGQLSSGANALQSGADSLTSGLTALNDGAARVAQGSQALQTGLVQLNQGAGALQTGSSKLQTSLASGAAKASQIQGGPAVVSMFATPVELVKHTTAGLPNYGSGFTPYFVSLGLYVGALVLSIIWSVNAPASKPRSATGWLLSKAAVLIPVGVLQAGLVDLVVLYGLHLHVSSAASFFGLSVLTSVTFLFLIQFLVSAFADVGRFIAIAILILQLTTSAGTFPLEVIPGTLQKFNQWLPMTYTVGGFRAIISGNASMLASNLHLLLIYPVAAVVLTGIVFGVYRFASHGRLMERTFSHLSSSQ